MASAIICELDLHNKHKRNMYKPSLTDPSILILPTRTPSDSNSVYYSHCTSHLHYCDAFRTPRDDYQDRVYHHCLDNSTTVLGDGLLIIYHYPETQGVLQQFTVEFQGFTRLLDLPPFASFTPDEKTRMVLGNPPPQVLQKGLKGRIMETTPISSEFGYVLRMYVTSVYPTVVDMSSDEDVALSSDNNYDFSPILLPPGFQAASTPQMTPYLYLLTPKDNR